MKERRELSKVAITRFRLIFALSLIGAPLLAILGLKSPVGDPGQAIFAIGGMGFVGCAVWAYRTAMRGREEVITALRIKERFIKFLFRGMVAK